MYGNFGQIAKEQTLCSFYRPLQHVGKRGLIQYTVKDVSLDPLDQKVYITHPKATTIKNSVDISVGLNMITHNPKV